MKKLNINKWFYGGYYDPDVLNQIVAKIGHDKMKDLGNDIYGACDKMNDLNQEIQGSLTELGFKNVKVLNENVDNLYKLSIRMLTLLEQIEDRQQEELEDEKEDLRNKKKQQLINKMKKELNHDKEK